MSLILFIKISKINISLFYNEKKVYKKSRKHFIKKSRKNLRKKSRKNFRKKTNKLKKIKGGMGEKI